MVITIVTTLVGIVICGLLLEYIIETLASGTITEVHNEAVRPIEKYLVIRGSTKSGTYFFIDGIWYHTDRMVKADSIDQKELSEIRAYMIKYQEAHYYKVNRNLRAKS